MGRGRLNACQWERSLDPAGLLPVRIRNELNSLPAPVLHGLVRACSANESALSYKLLQCVDGWALLAVAAVQISQTHMAIYLTFMHASHRSCISIYNIVMLHNVDHNVEHFCYVVCGCRHC